MSRDRTEGTSIAEVEPVSVGPPTKEVWKPDISKLPDAVVDGRFVPCVGQNIAIQYPEPWRETTVWRVQAVFDETCPTETHEFVVETPTGTLRKSIVSIAGTTCAPGYVRLFDVRRNQFGATNYIDAKSRGLVLKLWKETKK